MSEEPLKRLKRLAMGRTIRRRGLKGTKDDGRPRKMEGGFEGRTEAPFVHSPGNWEKKI
jgi:hypothetical protein